MTPFPKLHRTANEAAEAKRDAARAASEQSASFLDEIEGVLADRPARSLRPKASRRRNR
jgi:hypothetical protein